MNIATKPTKKHERLFLFSCDFVGFVANNTPLRNYVSFPIRPAVFLAGGWADTLHLNLPASLAGSQSPVLPHKRKAVV